MEDLFLSLISLAIYLIPFWIANERRLKNKWSIFFINLFLGWTLLGWVVCLAWAVSGTAEKAGKASSGGA